MTTPKHYGQRPPKKLKSRTFWYQHGWQVKKDAEPRGTATTQGGYGRAGGQKYDLYAIDDCDPCKRKETIPGETIFTEKNLEKYVAASSRRKAGLDW